MRDFAGRQHERRRAGVDRRRHPGFDGQLVSAEQRAEIREQALAHPVEPRGSREDHRADDQHRNNEAHPERIGLAPLRRDVEPLQLGGQRRHAVAVFLPELPGERVRARRTVGPDAERAAFDIAVDQVARVVVGRRFPDLEADQDRDQEPNPEDDAGGRLGLERNLAVEAREPEDREARHPDGGRADGADQGGIEKTAARSRYPGVEFLPEAKSVSQAAFLRPTGLGRSNPAPFPGRSFPRTSAGGGRPRKHRPERALRQLLVSNYTGTTMWRRMRPRS